MNQKLLCFLLSFGLFPAMAANSSNDRLQEKALVRELNPPEERLEELLPLLALPINNMPWTIRTKNILRAEGIYHIGTLVQRTEIELLRGPHFGKQSLTEVTEWLTSKGLQLGMNVNWPPNLREEELLPLLALPINNMPWIIRTKNILRAEGIYHIGALVQRTEIDLLRISNFGPKSLAEVKEWLIFRGFQLGMDVNWPSDPQEERELIRKLNPPKEVPEELFPMLALPIDSMGLSTRAKNALKGEGIYYIGALVQRTEIDLLRVLNFGLKGLAEVKEWLTSRDLRLGMDTNWPSDREREKELVKKLNPPKEIPEELIPILTLPTKGTDLAISIQRTLKGEGVNYMGALIHWTETKLRRRFSGIAVNKIKDWLASGGLQLGMNINWPSDPQEERALVQKLNPPKEEEWAGIFLVPQEEQILKMRLGIGEDPLTLEEVGEILNLSPKKVRQIQVTVLQKLYDARMRVNSDVLYHLGFKLYEGEGVSSNPQKAAEFWGVASVKGHADSQYNLGYLYFTGEGVERDINKARLWWERAAHQGHKGARISLNEHLQCSPSYFRN